MTESAAYTSVCQITYLFGKKMDIHITQYTYIIHIYIIYHIYIVPNNIIHILTPIGIRSKKYWYLYLVHYVCCYPRHIWVFICSPTIRPPYAHLMNMFLTFVHSKTHRAQNVPNGKSTSDSWSSSAKKMENFWQIGCDEGLNSLYFLWFLVNAGSKYCIKKSKAIFYYIVFLLHFRIWPFFNWTPTLLRKVDAIYQCAIISILLSSPPSHQISR